MRLLVAAHDFYPDPGSGGTGRYVYETARRLADRGHDVSVVTRRRGDVPSRETVAGVRVARWDLSVADHSAPEIAAQLPDAVATLRDHLAAFPDPDLVSFQGTVTDPLVDLLVPDRVPRSATVHSPWPTEYRIRACHEDRISPPRRRLNAALRGRIERRVLADCDQTIALSRFMARKLREVHGPVADLHVVPGGVDTECYRPDAGVYEPMVADGTMAADGGRRTDGEPIADRDSLALLTVRRLSPRMGHEMLLRAFSTVAGEYPEAHLYVAGDGPLHDRLERKTTDLGVADRVTYLGYVPDEDLPRAYASADCFVLPTRRLEGFGLATLEALASGTPVVATPVGGTTEILGGLRDADEIPTEMVTSSVDAEALADRLRAWAALDSEEREAAGRTCCKYASENYSWERTVTKIEDRYRTLV
jgi:glycosyltransferase involved in cell wall biosynthesis